MINEKLKYIVEQNKDKEKVDITLDLDEEVLEELKRYSEEAGLALEDFLEAILIDFVADIKKKEVIEEGIYGLDGIYDVYEFYRLEELLEELEEADEPFYIVNPTGKDMVLMKIEDFEELEKEFAAGE